jgi:hypothetical protein
MLTPGPWIVNGKARGDWCDLWRIDGCGAAAKVGVEFLMNPVALVKAKEDAETIAQVPEILSLLVAIRHCLKSYEFHNSATEPARDMAKRIEEVLKKNGVEVKF